MEQKILLIDDDPEEHEIFQFALDLALPETGCEHAFNCQDAVDKIRNGGTPSLGHIFLDMNMPCMELPKCIFSIKEALGNQSAEIIILTGYRMPDMAGMDELGITNVITKPGSVDMLADKIRQSVGKK